MYPLANQANDNRSSNRLVSDLEQDLIWNFSRSQCWIVQSIFTGKARCREANCIAGIIALLVASTSGLLIPKYGGMIIDIVSREIKTPEQHSETLDAIKNTITYILLIIIVGNYGVPLHLIRELYKTFRNFKICVADYLRDRKITSNLNDRFPDTTPEELNALFYSSFPWQWDDHPVIMAMGIVDELQKPFSRHMSLGPLRSEIYVVPASFCGVGSN
ncbi:hypothetical protein CRYUN_Cryun14cG0108800 [Craigia yunnanensis]